jgi:archaellum component FlaG (FlaF/FlaG flagellin family)
MHLLAIFLVLLMCCQFSGCAKTATTASVAPVTDVGVLPAHKTQSDLAVGADPYYSSRQKPVFGRDMSQEGILPVLVYLQNKGAQPLTVSPNNISLELQDGQVMKPTDPFTAAEKWGLKPGRYVAAGAFLGLAGVLSTKAAHEEDRAKLREEFQKKGLREVTLAKGESAQGFVYFYMPQGIQRATSASLVIPFLPPKGRGGEVRVPLGRM